MNRPLFPDITGPEVEPDIPAEALQHASYCGCAKPDDCWGSGGWHFAVAEGGEATRGGNAMPKGLVYAYEKCPAFWAAARRRRGQEAPTAKTKQWMRDI